MPYIWIGKRQCLNDTDEICKNGISVLLTDLTNNDVLDHLPIAKIIIIDHDVIDVINRYYHQENLLIVSDNSFTYIGMWLTQFGLTIDEIKDGILSKFLTPEIVS